jgi:hypothetical protein
MRYFDGMNAEEEASLMAEIEYEDAAYRAAAEFDVAPDEEAAEEAAQHDTLCRAALNRGQP